MEAGSGTSVTTFGGGCSTPSTSNRILAGAESLEAQICCDGRTLSFVTSSRRKPYLAAQLPFWDGIVVTGLGARLFF
jgi:hypothetical protein